MFYLNAWEANWNWYQSKNILERKKKIQKITRMQVHKSLEIIEA